jgi:hypothetical protein
MYFLQAAEATPVFFMPEQALVKNNKDVVKLFCLRNIWHFLNKTNCLQSKRGKVAISAKSGYLNF